MSESDHPVDYNMDVNIKDEMEVIEDITIHIKSEVETDDNTTSDNDHITPDINHTPDDHITPEKELTDDHVTSEISEKSNCDHISSDNEINYHDHITSNLNETTHNQITPDITDFVPNDGTTFETVQLEVKGEILSPNYEKDIVPSHCNIMVTLPTNLDGDIDKNIEIDKVDVKEEVGGDMVGYDYPNFDDESMDSADATALGNVEACLQDDVGVKTENEYYTDELNTNYLIKQEPDLTVTETHLISNKVINTTSTITHPQDGLIESRTTKTLVMEILPMTTMSQPLNKIGNPEEILPTTHASDDYDSFQLNSITGNVLSLEQEAYGLLKAKSDKKTMVTCPKCPKTFNNYYGLKRHLSVHVSIENREKGLIKGLETRKENQQKRLELMEKHLEERLQMKQQKKSAKVKKEYSRTRSGKIHVKTEVQKKKLKNIKSEDIEMKPVEIKIEGDRNRSDVKKEGYVCTCGEVFQRRSRMETCLRSHNMYSDIDNKYPCVTCMKQFKDKAELASHRKRLHRKKFPCKFCPTDYGTRKELFKHLQIHQKVQLLEYKVVSEFVKNKKKLRCFICTKSYAELSDLKCHVMEDHKEPYICPICSGTFCKIIDFAHHTKSFHPEVEGQSVLDVIEAFSKLVRAWKCEECNVQFHEADKLALHQIEIHSPDMKPDCQFQCPDCRRVFISQKGLTSHRRIHHSTESTEETEVVEKGVMCVECRKICKDMTALTSHMRLHSPERKYPCKFCDFRFATPEKRKAHAEIHNNVGDLKYVCFICEYQCSSENRLKQHKLSVKHSSMKEYLLTGKPLIEESSSSKKNDGKKKDKKKKERRDSDSESSDEVSCDICGEKFRSEAVMAEHKLTHPFIEFPNEDTPSRIFFK
ncbi:zinc finger protein 28-like [Plodia interpunctella]|uniref:zinc finger protein 28-like n=1 Tax=Plodia interpunctella TaxID=58824 RepID=UPI002368981D|nr:zinc finger protein 28-like [Plodia interpunctella]